MRFSNNFSTGSYPRFWDSNIERPRIDWTVENRGYGGLENLVQEGGMKIIADPDDDVFIDENKSLIK